MRYLARFSPLRAVRDLRLFLAQRQRHELLILAASVALTSALIAGFAHDAHEEIPYKRNIIYVQQWRADRSEAEILAQQKIDKVVKDKEIAAEEKERKERQAAFKRLDDKMKAWGL